MSNARTETTSLRIVIATPAARRGLADYFKGRPAQFDFYRDPERQSLYEYGRQCGAILARGGRCYRSVPRSRDSLAWRALVWDLYKLARQGDFG